MEQVRRYHLVLHPEVFRGIRRGRKGEREAIAFDIVDTSDSVLNAELWTDNGLQASVTGPSPEVEAKAQWLLQDLTAVVRAIEVDLAGSAITLIWVKGERIIPEEMPSTGRRVLGRLLSRSLLVLTILLFALNIILFFLLGIGAVIAILALQLLLIVFADRLFGLMGKWTITPSSPEVFLVRIRVSNDIAEGILTRRVDLEALKQAVYEVSFARGQEPTCPVIGGALARYGVLCSEDDIEIKTVNVLELVKEVASKFDAPLPRIIISNSLVPNAAASGISFKRGVLLLTGGILSQLNDDELVSVIGHEMGHLKGRDPLFLYAIVSGEFLLRFTLLFSLFIASPFLYLIISTFLIFFVAKFFEARADLLSVMAVGQPRIMAQSLRKIGFQRLQAERSLRWASWLRWDTHPPLYFRIQRLEAMSDPVYVRYPLLQSAKDVIGGFRASFSPP